MRLGLAGLLLWLAAGTATADVTFGQLQRQRPPRLVAATYVEPTARYPHGVLGDDIEYGALRLEFNAPHPAVVIRLPTTSVFEDVAPRLVDLDGDRRPEVITVESHQDMGARLAIFGPEGLISATPYIGQRFRWLAPIGAADLDGDGHIEIAYIDRPHLAKILRIWRYADGSLTQVASAPGFTNHRIGETDIAGGIITCKGTRVMLVASADWRRVMTVSFDGKAIKARELLPHEDRRSFFWAQSKCYEF